MPEKKVSKEIISHIIPFKEFIIPFISALGFLGLGILTMYQMDFLPVGIPFGLVSIYALSLCTWKIILYDDKIILFSFAGRKRIILNDINYLRYVHGMFQFAKTLKSYTLLQCHLDIESNEVITIFNYIKKFYKHIHYYKLVISDNSIEIIYD